MDPNLLRLLWQTDWLEGDGKREDLYLKGREAKGRRAKEKAKREKAEEAEKAEWRDRKALAKLLKKYGLPNEEEPPSPPAV